MYHEFVLDVWVLVILQKEIDNNVTVKEHINNMLNQSLSNLETVPCCMDGNIAMTPYSPLASGRLVRDLAEWTKRLEEDSFAKSKYDLTTNQDRIIAQRVVEIAEKRNMTRIQIVLSWLLSKVAAPVVGATKISYIEDISLE